MQLLIISQGYKYIESVYYLIENQVQRNNGEIKFMLLKDYFEDQDSKNWIIEYNSELYLLS